LRYGCTRFTWQEATYSLVVATGVCEESLILWTNEAVTTAEVAKRVVRAYLRRWVVGDAHRVLKQAFSLEASRVAGWRRVQRLGLLTGMAYGFVFHQPEGKAAGAEVRGAGATFAPPKKVIAYALRKGIAALWSAGLLKRPSFGFG
jgi:hypothetical protein